MFYFHEDDILSKKDFPFTIEEIKQTKEPSGNVFNCMMCFSTCHENCNVSDDEEKINCKAIDSEGFCKECTGHCIWSVHKNMRCIYRYTTIQVAQSYKEMKTRCENEYGKQLDFDEYLDILNKDIEALLERLHKKVAKITENTK